MQSWVGIMQTLTQYCSAGHKGIVASKGSDEETSDKEKSKGLLNILQPIVQYA